jgi:hypothetical protein
VITEFSTSFECGAASETGTVFRGDSRRFESSRRPPGEEHANETVTRTDAGNELPVGPPARQASSPPPRRPQRTKAPISPKSSRIRFPIWSATWSSFAGYPAHGDIERLAGSSLYPFVQFVWNVVNDRGKEIIKLIESSLAAFR